MTMSELFENDFKQPLPPLKFLVVGDQASGKTSIVKRYFRNEFSVRYRTSIGIDFFVKQIKINDEPYRIQLWDIPRINLLTHAHTKDTVGIIIVIDATQSDKTESAAKMINHLETKWNNIKNISVYVFYNKCDMVDDNVVSDANTLDRIYRYFSVSAKNNTNIVEALESIASTAVSLNFGITPLMTSVRKCDFDETIKIVSTSPIDVINAKDKQTGNTALIWACINNNTKYIEWYLDFIAALNDNVQFINIMNNAGQTAFMIVCAYGSIDVVQRFLQYEFVDVNVMNGKNGWCAVHYAAYYEQTAIVQLLLQSGKLDAYLSRSCQDVVDTALSKKLMNSLKILLSTLNINVDVNKSYDKGQTSLHIATIQHRDDIAKILLQRGVSIHAIDELGNTALYYASLQRDRDIITTLIVAIVDSASSSSTMEGMINVLVESCMKYSNVFSSGLAFHQWMIAATNMAKDCFLTQSNDNDSDKWNTFITHLKHNMFISAIDFKCENTAIDYALSVLRSAFCDLRQAQILHIHLVGDGKAGKSVAASWLIEWFQTSKESWDYNSLTPPYSSTSSTKRFHDIDVESGRTRGIQTTTLRLTEKPKKEGQSPKDLIIMIHDYGGQEEFLTNHANFLATDNSIYLIVVPLVSIGSNIKDYRIRSISDMLDRYLFWCRFIFSVIRNDEAFPTIENDANNVNSNKKKRRHGIPLITIINRFQKLYKSSNSDYSDDDDDDDDMNKYDRHIHNAIPVLSKQLHNEFIISNNINNCNCDFIVTKDIFHITDNACNEDILDIIGVIKAMVDNTVVNGEHNTAGIINYILNQYDISPLPIVMTKLQWKLWLHKQILTFPFTPSLTDGEILLPSQQDDLVNILISYCENTLLTINKIMILSHDINGYQIITNPSLLSTHIVGDLLWWFHKYNTNKMDMTSLKLSQQSIMEKLRVVHSERHHRSNNRQIKPDNSMSDNATALDILMKLENGVDSLPLVDLLNRIGLGLQIYDEQTQQMETWLLGLAPEFPKGERELRFDWWPDHEIRRYFRLPDTRACFIPGYFLRLFVNMVNNKGYTLIEGYGNAAKLSNTFRYPPGVSRCEVQILLCQLSDKDQDAFIVSVGARGDRPSHHALRALQTLRTLIYSDSWGLNFQEFCLPIHSNIDQMHLTLLRERLLDGKQALDEVLPKIFGVLSIVECFDDDDDNHIDCLSLFSSYKSIVLGHKPLWSIRNDEDGVQRLRNSAQHKPMIQDRQINEQSLSSGSETSSDNDIDVCCFWYPLDIFQRYAISCYPTTIYNELTNEEDCWNETVIRESLFRRLLISHDQTSTIQSIQQFNEIVDSRVKLNLSIDDSNCSNNLRPETVDDSTKCSILIECRSLLQHLRDSV